MTPKVFLAAFLCLFQGACHGFSTSKQLPTNPPKAAKPACPGEITWPDWRELFERFAADRQFMHRYLFNGDEVWPKNVDFCARARNSLLDLAAGPGTALELGLAGSAWESLLNTVAFTNEFKRLSDPLTGSDWLYVWPMVSTRQTADLELLMREQESAGQEKLPRHLVFPSILTKPARRFWPETDVKDLQAAWNRRLLGATVHRLVRQAATMDLSFDGYDLKNGRQRNAFYRKLDGMSMKGRHERLRAFAAFLQAQAERRGLLFPAERIQKELRRLLYTDLPGFEEPAGPAVLRVMAERNLTPELATRLARVDFITTGAYEGTRPLPDEWKSDREDYLALRALVLRLQERIAAVAAWPSMKAIVLRQAQKSRMVLSGNVYFATSHLEDSFTGYTHNGLVLNLPSRPGEPWLFDRVQAFFYANPVHALTKSALVELVVPAPAVVNARRRYAALPYRVHAPIRLAGGSTDVVNFVNMMTDWKDKLPSGYELGPEFLWGAIHVIPHLPQNRELRRFQYVRKIGQYSYIDYLNLRPLSGRDVYLIARCR